MNEREILQAVRDLIEKGWMQAAPAGVFDGAALQPCRSSDPRATHFCLEGAINRVCESKLPISLYVFELLSAQIGAYMCLGMNAKTRKITWWNDQPGRTKEQVIELIDKTLENLE